MAEESHSTFVSQYGTSEVQSRHKGTRRRARTWPRAKVTDKDTQTTKKSRVQTTEQSQVQTTKRSQVQTTGWFRVQTGLKPALSPPRQKDAAQQSTHIQYTAQAYPTSKAAAVTSTRVHTVFLSEITSPYHVDQLHPMPMPESDQASRHGACSELVMDCRPVPGYMYTEQWVVATARASKNKRIETEAPRRVQSVPPIEASEREPRRTVLVAPPLK